MNKEIIPFVDCSLSEGTFKKYGFKVTRLILNRLGPNVLELIADWKAEAPDGPKFKYPKFLSYSINDSGTSAAEFCFGRGWSIRMDIGIKGSGYSYFTHKNTKYGVLIYFIGPNFYKVRKILYPKNCGPNGILP